MATQAEQILKEKEIQGIVFSLYGKIFVSTLLVIITFFVTQTLYEVMIISLVNLCLIFVMSIMIRLVQKNKAVVYVGLFCILVDLLIITILPFVWYHAVGGESIPRTYLIKTSTHYIIVSTLILNAFTLQPIYPLLYSFGVVISQAWMLLYAKADPRFLSTESFKEAFLGSAAHVNNYITNMGVIAILGFILAYLTFRIRKTVLVAASNEVRSSQLSRYFSPNVIQEMASAEESFFQPGGKEMNVAVMFCDIVGFTQISEQLGPEKTMSFLSEYHSQMMGSIFEYRGTLDKFIGDGMLVTFGTPKPSPEDAKNAILAGLAMQKKVADWNEKRIIINEKPISIRIGIHYGAVIVGNVGISTRLEYTVIGDAVNAASRIEAMGKEVKKSFLISKDLFDQVKDTNSIHAKFKSLGSFALRGKAKATEILSVET
ncbi:adenylate/guanylate cyclase domain-containing protein [Leptospira ilyithenensis]|uniref:Adenylate/guanylate cyclase domain-containing protein n=1 Tax=Leptospira ilyithenensis TaxID=2484901 RepID=A0A4R9LTV3_9LEPT|nr:adenylate/guanylate cyclase domain-containing protein [Leptospira ilyithenensis]TGN11120.1 adenylate/guanylate cyclase domain-containing protein [Leptospira ilyithenensis]